MYSSLSPCSQLKSYLYAIELIWFLNQCDSSANTIIETFFFFNLIQNRILSPIFSIFLEQARQFSVVLFFFFKLWKHCSSVNQFQNNQDKFRNDCYKEIITLENTQNQLWLCRRFSPCGYCVTVESCWPRGSSTWIHVRLHLPFSGTWSLSESLGDPSSSTLPAHLGLLPGETWVWVKGLAGQDFMATWGATNFFFNVKNAARSQACSEELQMPVPVLPKQL